MNAPYSTRGNDRGCIATPLYWEEVGDKLQPGAFTIPTVLDRVNRVGNPFRQFREIGERQNFQALLESLGGMDE